MLVDLTVKEFLNKVAGSDPVPGGGSIAALNGAIASALAAMVANLTVGKKGYEAHEELMQHIAGVASQEKDTFIEVINKPAGMLSQKAVDSDESVVEHLITFELGS